MLIMMMIMKKWRRTFHLSQDNSKIF
ncbi:hypothetical protein NC653_039299 [Populus alba x Populus x berolinensis]|uniref:Uncharacterized protein n=1 Tax=Populus alba x Populus x berolinensis TaxID=444605 RepID=A0AAD6LB53_9ROSI|nr:hypothetical protein NC653_039299 [Populus alba x Populus x berolinensis]